MWTYISSKTYQNNNIKNTLCSAAIRQSSGQMSKQQVNLYADHERARVVLKWPVLSRHYSRPVKPVCF